MFIYKYNVYVAHMIYTYLRGTNIYIYDVFEIMGHNVYTTVPGESDQMDNHSHPEYQLGVDRCVIPSCWVTYSPTLE